MAKISVITLLSIGIVELINGQISGSVGFGGITDLQVGPKDGDLYVLSFTAGAIYRIVPSTTGDTG